MEINTILNNQWIKEEITKETRKRFWDERKQNLNAVKLVDAAVAVLRGKFIAVNVQKKILHQ